MRLETAYGVLELQGGVIRKVDGVRFLRNGYEYRLRYRGGFAAYVGIDRRKVGTRNFQYFSGIGAYTCLTVGQVMERVMAEIRKKEG